MDKFEEYLKMHLSEKRRMAQEGDLEESCPSPDVFYDFCMGRLQGEALERMRNYLLRNPWAQDAVLAALGAENSQEFDKPLPKGLEERVKKMMPDKSQGVAKCPYCSRAITPFRKPLKHVKLSILIWFFVSAAAFILSFFIRRYFMQCLAVCVLAGLKGMLEMRAMKTQIMIYKALDAGTAESGKNRLRSDFSSIEE